MYKKWLLSGEGIVNLAVNFINYRGGSSFAPSGGKSILSPFRGYCKTGPYGLGFLLFSKL